MGVGGEGGGGGREMGGERGGEGSMRKGEECTRGGGRWTYTGEKSYLKGEWGGGGTDRGAGEICVWFYEEKQEFNRHEESSFFFWGVGRAQERERRC